MLNKIWPIMIIISVIFGIFSGRIAEVNNAIFVSFEDTISMVISLLGIMCFWSGMIKVLENTKILKKIEKMLRPFIEKFFGEESEEAKKFISLNIVSDMLGIGNAATPVGIEAMKKMDESNSKKHLSYGMSMFILLNTLSIQIIPTTIISVRASLGSANPGVIILPVWITSIIVSILSMCLLERKKAFDIFSEGVNEGLKTVINLFPTLLALLLAVNMFRACGLINFLSDIFGGVLELFFIPKELTSLVFLKPISGSSSLVIATDLMKTYGVDSLIGLIASTILGATETTIYTIAIYTGVIKKKVPKKLIVLAIIGNFLGIFLSTIICNIMN